MEYREANGGRRVGQAKAWRIGTIRFTLSDRVTFASAKGSHTPRCTLGLYA